MKKLQYDEYSIFIIGEDTIIIHNRELRNVKRVNLSESKLRKTLPSQKKKSEILYAYLSSTELGQKSSKSSKRIIIPSNESIEWVNKRCQEIDLEVDIIIDRLEDFIDLIKASIVKERMYQESRVKDVHTKNEKF